MRFVLSALLASFALLQFSTPAPAQVIISEFMASNSRTLADEDGSSEDWIELQNTGTNTVNLLNWSLTDDPGNLNKWRFPGTNLPPGHFMVVFASNKDRTVIGSNLHTNFRLSAGGEYLALVQPDALTVASQFSPFFPVQVTDVSFGFGIESTNFALVSTGATVRVLIPSNGSLGTSWTLAGFDHSSWTAGTGGVGFDTGVVDPAEDLFSTAIASAGPIGWWRFEETSGTVATNAGALGSAANASYQGSPTLGQAGPRPPSQGGFESGNLAPRLNGTSSRVQVPDNAAFDFGAGAYSIALWFNPVNAATRGDLFTYKAAGNDFGIHLASQTTNAISVYHNAFIGTGGTVANNQWHYLVVTRDGTGTVTAYLNGGSILSGTDTASMSIANDLLFGSNHSGTPSSPTILFNGLLDEAAIYNRALSAQEVAFQYQIATSGGTSYAGLIGTDVRASMHGVNSSAFIRIPFVVNDVSAVDRLKLLMQYDDGFVAYLNGQEIASANAAETNDWDSAATARHEDTTAVLFEDFDVTDAQSLLVFGTNILAIQGLNFGAANPDFLIRAELEATTLGNLSTESRYFQLPTPGDVNGAGTQDLGPIIGEVDQTPALPARPADSDDIIVTARVTPAFTAVASVALRWRVMFGATNSMPMLDDGLHGDGLAGDGIYGAIIPASASTNGQMVRYYVLATDTVARSSRWPLFEDPLGSPEYLGTVVANPAVTSALPIWEWFAQDVTAARNNTGTRGAVFFKGRFYDNVRIRRRGAATTNGQKFDFNRGFRLFVSDELEDLDEVNLNNEASDPSFIRPPMAYESFRIAGNAACLSFNMLMRVNGGPDRVGIYVEQVDERFLERTGFDPEGALYKFIQRGTLTPIFTDPNDGVEKKTRLNEDRSDLAALCAALSLTNSPANRLAFIMDNFNVPALMTHLACRSVTMDSDDVRKNIYLYRDTRGNREWTIMPWDKDWSFGILGDGGTFLTNPYFGDQAHAKQNANQWSLLYHAVFTEPKLAQMYLRRLRTVMDQQLQPPGTPASSGYFEQRANAWFAPAFPHLGAGPSNAVYGASGSIRSFLPGRRNDLYVTFAATNTATVASNRLVPLGQLPNVLLQIGDIDYNPASSNQAEEYVQIVNNNSFAVDVSGWRLDGAVQHTFKPGTVILASNAMYVSPDVVAFRTRATGAGGGQGLLVQGNYQGLLSARGETLLLYDDIGRLVHTNAYPGSPSPVQLYLRVTEIMYHPSPLAGNTNSAEEFEYIELKNVGPVALNLNGVRFADGIEFAFAGSSITNLNPGQTVLLVKNLAAFAARYGTGFNIAGQYSGSLENRGENLRLEDAAGEKVLEFRYDNQWYEITDGFGFSVVIADENAPWNTWGQRASWRPSGQLGGSPGQTDPAPPAIARVVINEVLSRTDVPPPTDSIELLNLDSATADLSGWFLTDDFNTPKKFRIPNGTIFAPGSFVVFNEAQFNPGGTGFALSSDGDELFLFSADLAGNLTGYVHGFTFGAAENEVSFGRHLTSVGGEHFVAQSNLTLGSVNSGPKVGPIVISEVMYRPPDFSATNDNSADEFIELCNVTSNTVPLADSNVATNTWTITGGVDFVFPTNQALAANACLLLVNFDPSTNAAAATAFRNRHSVWTNVLLLGPYGGKLDNSSDRIRLNKPTTPLGSSVPFVLVDEVEYTDAAPWPAAADGGGASLQRKVPVAYGNDPAQWLAAGPTPGIIFSDVGTAPVITSQAASQTLIATVNAAITVNATGTAPLHYQWRLNGLNILGATNSVLTLTNVQADDAGAYTVVVHNSAGSAVSSTMTVNVIYAAAILAQPQSVQIRVPPDPLAPANRTVTFSVQAYSASVLRYQWRFKPSNLFNPTNLPGATNSALILTNVQVSDGGEYTVAVTDDIGTIFSAPATFYPLVSPKIVLPPLSQTVPANGAVILSVTASGSPFPFGYEWRRGSFTVASNTASSFGNFYSFTARSFPTSETYRVIVRNLADLGITANAQITVAVVADSDNDGIPDTYEAAYGVGGQLDPAADNDNDTMSNLAEYIAGTDPTDPSSYLKINSLTRGGGATLQFDAASNKTYTVLFTDALGNASWQRLIDVAGQTNAHLEVIADADHTTNRIYRLATPKQP
jgi:hypothetical protein